MPHWLYPIIHPPLAEIAIKLFDGALGYVWWQQRNYTADSMSNPLKEIKGLVDGMCSHKKFTKECSSGRIESRIKKMNMLPELVKMQCSMMGAWGKATLDGNLV